MQRVGSWVVVVLIASLGCNRMKLSDISRPADDFTIRTLEINGETQGHEEVLVLLLGQTYAFKIMVTGNVDRDAIAKCGMQVVQPRGTNELVSQSGVAKCKKVAKGVEVTFDLEVVDDAGTGDHWLQIRTKTRENLVQLPVRIESPR